VRSPSSRRSFDRQSPVTAYWLTRCEGFRVRAGRDGASSGRRPRRSGALGRLHGDPLRARARRLVPAEAVDAVVPAERLLVLRSSGRRIARLRAVRRAGLRAGA